MIARKTIDEIMQTARIEEVIGDFLHLKRAGSNLKALSPFVNEKTPSFMVSPAKQIFKDFSSGKGGNVVTFLQEHEHMSYPEALRFLADRYNITIEEDGEQTPEQLEEQNKRESLYIVTKFALDFFKDQLHETEDGQAIGLSYFKERQFETDIIKKFDLGYAPGKNIFTKTADDKGYKDEYLLDTGLIKQNDRGKYDGFRKRVIFPIHDLSGRPVGFGARTLRSDPKVPKYINSPESDIYKKNRILYGIFQAKHSIIKNDLCFLVEGYTDVISLHQAGIENAVASSGTALTEGQIKLIKRYTQNVTILYDGDPAGIKASFRGIDLILQEGMNVKVVLLPEGDDPDSYAKNYGKEKTLNYVGQNQTDFITFKTNVLLKDVENDPLKKSQAIRDIVNSIAQVPDHISRAVFIQECSSKLDVPEKAIIAETNKIRRNQFNQQRREKLREQQREERENNLPESEPENFLEENTKPVIQDEIKNQEREILRLILKYGSELMNTSVFVEESQKEEDVSVPVGEFLVSEIIADELTFQNQLHDTIFEEIAELTERDGAIDEQHFIHHENDKIREFVVDLLAERYELHDWEKKNIFVKREEQHVGNHVEKTLYKYKLACINQMIQANQNKMKTAFKSEEPIDDILLEQRELDKIKMELSQRRGSVVIR